ncbi:SDR family oxidoreductase [Curtobacterium sp. YC1]|uniref:SDR family NAD(P)-dependent oxidoreductase n=1 Tax=Curtobacterium sp. YC1 TaxID=2795488 RepID=UPI0018E56713|nr:SDR family oxidoreductase [Curtobacterium sp. YC1]QQD76427.1 SDR family oxidoreductase [Curtobacterium sp. YC1]
MTNQTASTPIGLLSDKVVLITGASRGIGAAAARLFAREGARVVLAARSTEALEAVVADVRGSGGTADAVALDLADPDSIRAAVARVDELHGRLDAAFNNGATIQQPGPLDTTSDEDIDTQFAVNFRGHWVAMTAEAALMRRSGGGAIVNTSSIGSRRANPALPAYGAMKRALNSITETAAVTWAPERIRVNGIAPGGTATEMIEAWEAATPGVTEQINASVPLGRMAEPVEVAEVAAWLLSDRADRPRRRGRGGLTPALRTTEVQRNRTSARFRVTSIGRSASPPRPRDRTTAATRPHPTNACVPTTTARASRSASAVPGSAV